MRDEYRKNMGISVRKVVFNSANNTSMKLINLQCESIVKYVIIDVVSDMNASDTITVGDQYDQSKYVGSGSVPRIASERAIVVPNVIGAKGSDIYVYTQGLSNGILNIRVVSLSIEDNWE